MKVLFVDDEKPSFVMYPQTESFLRALRRKCEVTEVRVDTEQTKYDFRDHKGYDIAIIWQSVTSHRRKDLFRLFEFSESTYSCAIISDFFHPCVRRSPVIYNPFMQESLRKSKLDVVFTTYQNTYEWSLLLPETSVYYLPYCVDNQFFKDLRLPREDSLLVCCSTNAYLYPFRTRVVELLYNQNRIPCQFRVNPDVQWGNTVQDMELDAEARRNAAFHVLEDYRELVNKHTAFLATTSIGPGVELKFAEAILCGACVVGDLPELMYSRYRDAVPLIHSCMTDGEILDRIAAFFSDPTPYVRQQERAKEMVRNDFGPETCVDALLEVMKRYA